MVVYAAGPVQHLAALERRLFRLGQRTKTLVTSPRSDEPIDQGADEGVEDFIRFHAERLK